MMGAQLPSDLPNPVREQVAGLLDAARARFGPIRMEWVVDTLRAWVLQCNMTAAHRP